MLSLWGQWLPLEFCTHMLEPLPLVCTPCHVEQWPQHTGTATPAKPHTAWTSLSVSYWQNTQLSSWWFKLALNSVGTLCMNAADCTIFCKCRAQSVYQSRNMVNIVCSQAFEILSRTQWQYWLSTSCSALHSVLCTCKDYAICCTHSVQNTCTTESARTK